MTGLDSEFRNLEATYDSDGVPCELGEDDSGSDSPAELRDWEIEFGQEWQDRFRVDAGAPKQTTTCSASRPPDQIELDWEGSGSDWDSSASAYLSTDESDGGGDYAVPQESAEESAAGSTTSHIHQPEAAATGRPAPPPRREQPTEHETFDDIFPAFVRLYDTQKAPTPPQLQAILGRLVAAQNRIAVQEIVSGQPPAPPPDLDSDHRDATFAQMITLLSRDFSRTMSMARGRDGVVLNNADRPRRLALVNLMYFFEERFLDDFFYNAGVRGARMARFYGESRDSSRLGRIDKAPARARPGIPDENSMLIDRDGVDTIPAEQPVGHDDRGIADAFDEQLRALLIDGGVEIPEHLTAFNREITGCPPPATIISERTSVNLICRLADTTAWRARAKSWHHQLRLDLLEAMRSETGLTVLDTYLEHMQQISITAGVEYDSTTSLVAYGQAVDSIMSKLATPQSPSPNALPVQVGQPGSKDYKAHAEWVLRQLIGGRGTAIGHMGVLIAGYRTADDSHHCVFRRHQESMTDRRYPLTCRMM